MIVIEQVGTELHVAFRYDPAVIAKMRTVPTAHWNPAIRQWVVSAQFATPLRSKRVMAAAGVDEKDVLLMSLKGLVSQNSQEDVVVQGSGLSRGDRRRGRRTCSRQSEPTAAKRCSAH